MCYVPLFEDLPMLILQVFIWFVLPAEEITGISSKFKKVDDVILSLAITIFSILFSAGVLMGESILYNENFSKYILECVIGK